MRPLYLAWLQFVVWLGGMALWLFYTKGAVCWWQPFVIWIVFILLFVITERLGYAAGALPLVSLLVLIGWLFLSRLDAAWAENQFWGVLIGAGAYLVGLFSRLPETLPPLMAAAGALVPLGLVSLFGRRIAGAKAWLTVAGVTFQPIEFARIFLVIYLGRELAKEGMGPKTGAILASFLLLLAWQTDFGPALLMFFVFVALLFTVDFSWRNLTLYLGLAALASGAAVYCFPHLRTRLLAWLTPWDYLEDKGYQILQGLFALNSGGVVGRGLGAGMINVIPAGHTDYLLAIIGEELGLLGTFSLLLIYLGLAFWALKLLSGVRNGALRLTGLGFVLLLHGQIFLVCGGILRLVPFTGMTLPFVSYGSSSLVAQFWMLGMLTGLGREEL